MLPAQGFNLDVSPSAYTPGEAVAIAATYQKPGSVQEKRLVFIFELRRVEDESLVVRQVRDNATLGYTESTISFDLSLPVPPTESAPLYVAAWAVPWSMNTAFVAQNESYPTNGTFTYLWQGGGYGVTQNVFYLGSLICPKPAGNTTYCSGLAFEAFVVAWNNYNTTYGHPTIGNITTATQMEAFRKRWYGVTDSEKLAARAIPEYSLGVEITNFEEAQKGDALQFWRHSGSGHNPVFVNWVRNSQGTITGVRYWGSQGSTNGIGYATESFGVTSGINPARLYLARARKPRDQADYDWAVTRADTKSSPLVDASGIDSWLLY